MISPQPESDMSLNALVVGSDMIRIMKESEDELIIEDLLIKFLKKDNRRSHILFFDVLTFLYALDIIKVDIYKVSLRKKRSPKLKQLTDFFE